MATSAVEFWDSQYELITVDLPDDVRRAVADAEKFFGDLRGKRVLDIGCGNGQTTLMLARAGAIVTGVDNSSVAADKLQRYVESHAISNVTAVCADAMRIDELGKFDCVFGSLILHHLEPFSEFCLALRGALRPGGRAFFLENNAASEILIWFRTHVVGRLWVPRFGDGVEFPLTPREIRTLRQHFDVEVRIPEMVFFQLVSAYLLRRRLAGAAKALDDLMFRWNIGTKYSYRQCLLIEG